MDNSGKEKEAMQLMAEADKKVKASGSFLGGMFGGNHKVEDACEMYARAANMFKMAKNWSAAGNAFCQAARLHMQLQNKLDSATSFVDAGNAYKKADPQGECFCHTDTHIWLSDHYKLTFRPCIMSPFSVVPQIYTFA
uniref:NSF attachment protein beta n=1 Tax=Pundamilia nyererei TaxID=303518 RepID=A0A3B4FFV5_9CICH